MKVLLFVVVLIMVMVSFVLAYVPPACHININCFKTCMSMERNNEFAREECINQCMWCE
jgi:hypothetical protein